MNYDHINPPHYKQLSVEVSEMMIRVYGRDAFKLFCELCIFKYRMRLGNKPDQPIERDMEKIRWYENKIKDLENEK